MKRNSMYIALALGAVVLLAGCNAKSPTAPKPTAIPALGITLTPETTTAKAGDSVLVTAHVTSGSASAPDGTTVTFDVSGGTFPPTGATEAVRTTTGGGTSIGVTAGAGTATILGRVPGASDQVSVTFTGVQPTPTPTGPPDYTPVIYALTPNAGPFEGGTRVTISGTGFQTPVQVLFTTPNNGTYQAQVVSTTYTEVVCISPSITPGAPTGMVPASVTVTNINNGKVSPGVNFQYGVTMFISSFTPMEGPADVATTVTIFGQGFVAPVSVVATGGVQWDVMSVAGTEIVVKTKPLDNAHVCSGGSTTFTVTNINSNTTATSPGSFTYRAVHPLITSVQIGLSNLVAQCGGTCAACAMQTITIHGSGFQTTSTMSVTLNSEGGGSVGPLIATVTDANTMTISVTDLSALTPLTTSCGGGTGQSNISTPIDVTVRNVRYDCSDQLNGALVLVPCNTSCVVLPAPTVSSVSPNNGPIAGGTSVTITGTNFVSSGLSATFGGAPATGVTFIDASHIQAITPGLTPANPVAVGVTCGGQSGTLLSGFTFTATMDVTIVGTGTVNATDFLGAFSCSSATCQALFGTSLPTLSVTTSGTFNGWSGGTCGCSGTGSCTPLMNQDRACTATFTP